MATYGQLLEGLRKKKVNKIQTKALRGCPQKRGVCVKVYTTNPKKPNSAVRKVCKVRLCTGRFVLVGIGGQGHNLRKDSVVLIRGGRLNDVPGIRYKVLRGKLDCTWVEDFQRKQRRSKYGVGRKEV